MQRVHMNDEYQYLKTGYYFDISYTCQGVLL
jgi:hypothetical protein